VIIVGLEAEKFDINLFGGETQEKLVFEGDLIVEVEFCGKLNGLEGNDGNNDDGTITEDFLALFLEGL
jgi:hypothetical protein